MSSIASLRVIDRSAVAATSGSAAVDRMLSTSGRDLSDLFAWSGYCMVDLLAFLGERGIVSTEPDLPVLHMNDGFTAMFGPGDSVLLDRLDPQAFSSEDLIEAMGSFDLDNTEAVRAATDGLEALRAGIGGLNGHELLVIWVG